MKCKNCGNDVQPKMSIYQIIFAMFLSICFFVIPGVLYAVICKKVTCPVCKKNIYQKETNNTNNKDITIVINNTNNNDITSDKK